MSEHGANPTKTDVVVAVWSTLSGRTLSSHAELSAAVSHYSDSERLLGAIAALADGDRHNAATLLREFADAIDDRTADQCPYCLGDGTIERRYGTAGAGPAKRVKTRECPNCGGAGRIQEIDP
jgi:hypothetical protein